MYYRMVFGVSQNAVQVYIKYFNPHHFFVTIFSTYKTKVSTFKIQIPVFQQLNFTKK